MDKNKRLIFRILAVMAAVFLVTAVITGIAVYVSSKEIYLTAKNDMIERDLTRSKKYIDPDETLYWYLKYWEEHPAESSSPMTYEEMTAANDELFVLAEPKDQLAMLESSSDEVQLAFAKDKYTIFLNWVETELDMYCYDGLYMIDIGEENTGFVFFRAGMSRPDDIPKFNINEHPAVKKLISGDDTDAERAEFEIINNGPSGNHLYIGYMPLLRHDGINAVICIAYDWEHFHAQLMQKVIVVIVIILIAILDIVVLMTLYLKNTVVRPIEIMRSAVQNYMNSKNCTDAVNSLGGIKASKEINTLSENFSEMAVELDRYIGDIQQARENEKKFTVEFMEALARTIDAKDKYTNGHSERVAIYSRMLARQLGMTLKEQ